MILAVTNGAFHDLAISSTWVGTLPTGLSLALPLEGQFISKEGSGLAPAEASAFAFAHPLRALDHMAREPWWLVNTTAPPPLGFVILPMDVCALVVL